MNRTLTADELSAQTLENRECRPILAHTFQVEVSTVLGKEDAKDFLQSQILAGRLNTRYEDLQERWPNFGGAKITIK